MRIAVAGGTGVVGAHVVDVARERGHEVVVLSRSHGVDLVAGTDLPAVLRGADAVIDVLSTQTRSARQSEAFFRATTRTLLAAERRAGVGHHLVLSIVGAAEAPHGYYAGKALQEQLVESGDVPWTILRATQFHEFARQIFGAITVGPLVLVPRMRSQPIAALEVAERLVALAEAGPARHARELGGPQERWMQQLVREYASATGDRRPILALPLPGPWGKALRDGTLLPGPDADRGRQTFEEWLASGR